MSKLVTGKVRASFCNLEEPNTMSDKYQLDILIPKDSPEVKRVNSAVNAAVKEGQEKKWDGKKPAKLLMPLKDGDEKIAEAEKPELYKAYEGMYYLTPKAVKPSDFYCFDRDRNVISPDEIYSGCYIRCSMEFFPYKHEMGGKGVSVALRAIQFVADGESLGGGRQTEDSARSAFDDDFDDWGDDDWDETDEEF